jgi:hypothetical protein
MANCVRNWLCQTDSKLFQPVSPVSATAKCCYPYLLSPLTTFGFGSVQLRDTIWVGLHDIQGNTAGTHQ